MSPAVRKPCHSGLKRTAFWILLSFIALSAFIVPASAVIHTLNPGDSIQTNITNAAADDILILNPGTYSQKGIAVSKNITIRANTSYGGNAENTIIDGTSSGRIFKIPGAYSFALDNLTLRNGVVSGENGGGIYAGSGSTVNITSSTVSGCSADYGGAIYAEGSTVSVLSSSFTGNKIETGTGSAVYSASGSTVTIHFCRFYTNDHSYVDSDWGESVDATNNWWATNSEPAMFYDVGGDVSYTPWLVMGTVVEPPTITGGSTNAVRANLTYNSDGQDTSVLGHVPDGIPVTFGIIRGLGSLDVRNGNLKSGLNTTTLTPAAFGSVRLNTTLDSQSVILLVPGTETVPEVTGIQPVTGINISAIPVVVTGSGFNATSLPSVNLTQDGFNTVSLTVVSGNSTAISATVPESTPAGTWNVTVINPYGTEGTNASVTFTVTNELPAPEIISIRPATNLNTTWTPVNISGNWFNTKTTPEVKLKRTGFTSITLTNITVLSMTSLSGRIPAHVAAGTWNVTVVNPDGKEGSNASVTFTSAPPPVLPLPAFSATPLSGELPMTVQFTDQSAGSPTGRAWFFGDENYTQPWTLQTDNPGYYLSDYPEAVALPDGSIVMVNPVTSSYPDEIWRSTDQGKTWTKQNPAAEWDTHFSSSLVAMPDGSIVLMGGADIDRRFSDTWRSTDQGKTWIQMNASGGWEPRYAHTTVVLPDNSIVLMAGNNHGSNLRDVWRSTDYGETWTLQTSNPGWSARSAASSVALSDGSIVTMGGMVGATSYANDTWRSTDAGKTWARMNASSGWSKRRGLTGVVMPDDSILVMGGESSETYDYTNDTWRSTDKGATWTRLNESAAWPVRCFASGVVLPDGSVVLIGAYNSPYNDVWRFNPVGSSETNPSHTYITPGNYTVTLQAYTAEGFNRTQKAGYVRVNKTQVPAPTLTSISPATGLNTTTILVMVTGTGFNTTTAPAVNLTRTGFANVSLMLVNVSSSTSLNGTVPANIIAGPWNVTVINPDSQEGTNASVTYTATASPMKLFGISPSYGSNASLQPVTITGSGFNPAIDPTVNLTRAGYANITLSEIFVARTSTSFEKNIPAGIPAGVWNVVVTDPDSRSEATNASVTYTAWAPAPAVTGITPSGGFNTSDISITDLAGSDFQSGASVFLTPAVSRPVHAGSITNGTGGAALEGARSVFVLGRYAYVASWSSNALEILDVNNPAAPVHAGKILNGDGGAALENPISVYVAGNYAYVGSTGSEALEIVDVRNPASPVHAGKIVNGDGDAALWYPSSVYVSGNYAYVADRSSDALEIVNISNPGSPVHAGKILDGSGGAALQGARDVFVSGGYAYVASGVSKALQVVDVTVPESPLPKGKITNGGSVLLDNPSDVFVSGNYAYVVSEDGDSLEIVNVTDPANPQHAGSLSDGQGGALLNSTMSIFVTGNYAYVASEKSQALEVINLTIATAPVHAGSIVNGGSTLLADPRNVFVSGRYAYVASTLYDDGIEIIDTGMVPVTGVTVVSPAKITGTLNLANATAGQYNIAVTNPDGRFGVLAKGFDVKSQNPPPVVTGISPASGLNMTTTSVTITGTGFNTTVAPSVNLTRSGFANVSLTDVSAGSPASLTGTVPAGIIAGPWNVTVINPDGQEGTNVSVTYTATAALSVITLNPGDSIKENITVIADGGTIILNPGIFTENSIDVTKNVTIRANTSYGGTTDNTVIDATSTGRIFNITASKSLAIDNLTLKNGHVPGSGGAIFVKDHSTVSITSSTISNCSATGNGGALYLSLLSTYTLSSSTITDCSSKASGGGIYTSGAGPTTITSSTIANCTAPQLGGAIANANSNTVTVISSTIRNCSVTTYGGAVAMNNGNWLNVTSSTITNCQAKSGGAVYATGSLVNISIYASTIANCTATNRGGGISADAIHELSIKHSRIFGNSALTGPAVSSIFTNCYLSETWWGSNADPQRKIAGTTAYSPWLVLGITADPATVTPGTPSTIRANLTYDSAGAWHDPADGAVPNSMLIAYTLTQGAGTLQPERGNTRLGMNASVFTPSNAMTAMVNATVDDESVGVRLAGLEPAPTIESISPATMLNTSAVLVTVNGTGFSTGALPRVNLTRTGFANVSLTLVNVSSSTSLNGTVPANVIAGPWNLTVINPDGQGGTNASVTFTVTSPEPAPVLNMILPASALNTTTTSVTIYGDQFNTTVAPKVNLSRSGYTNISLDGTPGTGLSFTATVPANLIAGPWNVTVINPDGQEGTNASVRFMATTVLPAPIILGIEPETGDNIAPVDVELTGTNFDTTSDPVVNFTRSGYSNVTLDDICVIDSTSLTARVPAGIATGLWNITLENPDGKEGTNVSVAFIATSSASGPTLTAIAPVSGSNTTSTLLSVTGTNFDTTPSTAGPTLSLSRSGYANVTIPSTNVTSLSFTSTVPPGTIAGVWNVSVFNPDGDQGTNASVTFTVTAPVPAPTVVSISPVTGLNTTTTLVTITGTGFNATAPTVNLTRPGFGNVPLTGVIRSSSTSLTGTVPAGVITGPWTVAVTNPDGQTGTNASVIFTPASPGPVPVADFTIDTVTGTVPLTVTFTDQSSNSPTSWLWNFGDGTTGTTRNPDHTYTTIGTYDVTLSATNAIGTGSLTKYRNITVTSQVNESPANYEGVTLVNETQKDFLFNITDIRNTGGTVTNLSTTLVDYQPPGWQRIVVTGMNVSNDSAYIYADQVNHVSMTTLPYREIIVGVGTAESQFTLEQSTLSKGVAFGRDVVPGGNQTILNLFQETAPSGQQVNLAYTLQIYNDEAFNANLTGTRPVFINLSASHTWVTGHGGTGAIRIFHLPDSGIPEMLPTTYIGGDGVTDHFTARADTLSVFGLAGLTTAPVPTPQPTLNGGGFGDEGPSRASARQELKAPLQQPLSTVSVNVGQIGRTSIISVDVTGVEVRDMIITSTELSGPGSDLPPPPGIVYEYADISPARFTEITDAKINFYVPLSWLDQHNLAPEDIILYHNTGRTWEALPTTLDYVRDGKAYYTAIGSEFSRFAITGQPGIGTKTASPSVKGQTFGDLVPASGTPSPTYAAPMATRTPVTTRTTTVPVAQPEPAFPYALIIVAGAAVVVLIGGVFLVRRWWIRRQNPALFREYD